MYWCDKRGKVEKSKKCFAFVGFTCVILIIVVNIIPFRSEWAKYLVSVCKLVRVTLLFHLRFNSELFRVVPGHFEQLQPKLVIRPIHSQRLFSVSFLSHSLPQHLNASISHLFCSLPPSEIPFHCREDWRRYVISAVGIAGLLRCSCKLAAGCNRWGVVRFFPDLCTYTL